MCSGTCGHTRTTASSLLKPHVSQTVFFYRCFWFSGIYLVIHSECTVSSYLTNLSVRTQIQCVHWSVSIFHVDEHPLGGNEIYRSLQSKEPNEISSECASVNYILFPSIRFIDLCLTSPCFVDMFVWRPDFVSRCWRSSRSHCPHHYHPSQEHQCGHRHIRGHDGVCGQCQVKIPGSAGFQMIQYSPK